MSPRLADLLSVVHSAACSHLNALGGCETLQNHPFLCTVSSYLIHSLLPAVPSIHNLMYWVALKLFSIIHRVQSLKDGLIHSRQPTVLSLRDITYLWWQSNSKVKNIQDCLIHSLLPAVLSSQRNALGGCETLQHHPTCSVSKIAFFTLCFPLYCCFFTT